MGKPIPEIALYGPVAAFLVPETFGERMVAMVASYLFLHFKT